MNSKERRKLERAQKFQGHQPELQYRPEKTAQIEGNRSGREWDSERAEKADERELEQVDKKPENKPKK
jgi:hypothetical protein